jgi:hypothetical protein
MKILITGMNKLQNNEDFYLKQQLEVVPSHYALIRGLRYMGHDVEQRFVEVGEDISSYDKVILFLHNPSGFCGYVYNGLYVLSQREDCIIAFDDWQIDSIYDGLNKLKDDLFRKYIVEQSLYDVDFLKKYENLFLKSFEILERKSNKVLISAFSNGDTSLLFDYNKDLITTYNPNPFHLNRKLDGFVFEKEKRYNFSSLVQGKTAKWIKKLNCNYPIDYYGSRKDNQIRLKEQDMVNVYAKDWFCLMPGYYHSGSGWWRARPLQLADAGSILIGDKKELMVYYNNIEAADVSINNIESMNDNQLNEFALFQKECIYKNHPLDKNIFVEELKYILNE